MHARPLRDGILVRLLAGALCCAVSACEAGEEQGDRALLDASAQGSEAGTEAVDGQLQRDAGARDGSVLDASISIARDGAVQSNDAGTSMDLCGNLRPASASESGVLPGSIVLLPAVTQHRSVLTRGPGKSALFGGRLLWLFGQAFDRSTGKRLVGSSATLSSFDRPLVLDESAPDAPLPSALLPDAQADADAGVNRSTSYALGGPIAVGLTSVLVFYTPSSTSNEAVARGTQRLGTHVARVRGELGSIVVEPEPTPLFPGTAPSFRSGLLAGDGYVYLYGCRPREGERFDCLLARAPLGNATRAGAYTYRTAGGWSNDLTVASVVLADMHEDLTVAYNDYLRSYLAVSLHGSASRITLRTAPRPEGPWSAFAQIELPPLDATRGEQLGNAVEHHALASKCDRALTLSYVRTTRTGEAQLLPIKLELR